MNSWSLPLAFFATVFVCVESCRYWLGPRMLRGFNSEVDSKSKFDTLESAVPPLGIFAHPICRMVLSAAVRSKGDNVAQSRGSSEIGNGSRRGGASFALNGLEPAASLSSGNNFRLTCPLTCARLERTRTGGPVGIPIFSIT